MIHRTPLAVLAAALLLSGCAKDDGRAAAAASDSAAIQAAAQTPGDSATANVRPGGGVIDYARQGVDSSNAMQQQRLNEVNDLSQQASGTTTP